MINQIASALGRNDETPNIELAVKIVQLNNEAGIKEIVSGLYLEKSIANDCIKVLYEIGERNPKLIVPYTDVFISLLNSKNNRLVWGAMTALGQVAALSPVTILARFDEVCSAYENGSVITVDHSISVFAALYQSGKEYREKVLPILLNHLANCRTKEIPQHIERMSVCFTPDNMEQFKAVLQGRYDELSKAQQARVNRVMNKKITADKTS